MLLFRLIGVVFSVPNVWVPRALERLAFSVVDLAKGPAVLGSFTRSTTSSPDFQSGQSTSASAITVRFLFYCFFAFAFTMQEGKAESPDVQELKDEVKTKGWVVFSARSVQGDWDLFLMRPDGSQRRSLTNTPEWSEFAPQFSRDGNKLLYRRIKHYETISGNSYGDQGTPVVCNSDGTKPYEIGKSGDLPWASWSPDGKELTTLSIKGISFVDAATGAVLRRLPRKGFYQQLTWSPDGRWLCGVSNSFGTGWSVARMDATTGEANAVSRIDCCTPDWFLDSQKIIFSNRPSGQKENDGQGWTQLWSADANGENRKLVFGEDGRHIYGGHVSPDGLYVLFTGNPQEDGDPQNSGAPMALIRLGDSPIIGGKSVDLRELHPAAKSGPVLSLPAGWEPCWTLSETPAGGEKSKP